MQDVVKLCYRERIPFVARGSGTGLSGGALPVKGGVVISIARMNRILEVDIPNARVVVEPGVTNAAVTAAVAPHGYFYAPDPSSQVVCTVAGNVAENSGGAHCFKYGVTTTYILGLDVVLSDGSLVHLGGNDSGLPGYDLVGSFVGSEGTFGIVTKITCGSSRSRRPSQTMLAAFNSTSEAGRAVSAIIASGMLPGGHGDHGPPRAGSRRGRGSSQLSGVQGAAAGGAGRLGARGRAADGKAGRHVHNVRGLGDPSGEDGGGARWPSGRDARRRLPPWAASRRITLCRTA